MYEKPTAFERSEYPYEQLPSRDFEKLLYHIFDQDIKHGVYGGIYDQIDLMQGVGERGRDSVLYFKGAKVGVIQCKRNAKRLSKPEVACEIIKFSLHYLKDSSLITDLQNFTYYLAASKDFSEPAIELLSDFNNKIIHQTDLEKWTQKVIRANKSLKGFHFSDVKNDLLTILCSIKIQKITMEDLSLKLELYPHLISLFFQVKKVHIVDDTNYLSKKPRTERPLLEHSLVGREEDLIWLQTQGNDKLLVGQPGSGKTFLLYQLAREAGVFFVVCKERDQIASAINLLQPKVLIVDDVHTQRNHEIILDLLQLRVTLGVGFSIIASCWPGEKSEVTEAMNLTEPDVRQLELLTRPQIVEIIKATGLYGSNDLIREIVDQAEGRPGLAVTLAQLCLKGGVREVVLGDALSRSTLKLFKSRIGNRASLILAALSIGGDAGMLMKDVAAELNIHEIDLWESITELSHGGTVLPIDQNYISVRPAALRQALVRDVFFKGLKLLPIESLIFNAPNLSQTTHTLIGAKAVGADIPRSLLVSVLEQAHSDSEWERFVGLGYDEAKWTLDNHPEKIIRVGRSALCTAPKVVIPLLLEKAIGNHQPLHSNPQHPLRLIQDWIHDGRPGSGEVLNRRNILLASARDWLLSGKDSEVGLFAFQLVMSPKIEYHSTDPGMGNTFTIYSRYPTLDEIYEIQRLWPLLLEVMAKIEIKSWNPVREIVEAWAYPGRVNVQISLEQNEAFHSFTSQLLADVVSMANNRPGVLHWANELAKNLELKIEISLDPEFETLYPIEDLENWRQAEEKQKLAVEELADRWGNLNPRQTVEKIMSLEKEAQSASITWPRWTPLLCEKIAEKIVSPNDWIRAMIDLDSAGDLVAPFLEKAARMPQPSWIELAEICLDRAKLKGAAIALTLTLNDPPKSLLDRVLEGLDGYAQLVKILCLRNQVPEAQLMLLLKYQDHKIACAAAHGEWVAEPQGTVRSSIYEAWHQAILERVDDDHLLSRVLKNEPKLAYEWLQKFVGERYPSLYRYENAIESAVGTLNFDNRKNILEQISKEAEVRELVFHLIGGDLTLYKLLLSNKKLKRFHLIPLSGIPEEVWLEKAKLALSYGYDPEDIARASWTPYKTVVFWHGNESAVWEEWVERFSHLCIHSDKSIQLIGETGVTIAELAKIQALKKEKQEAIYGLY